MNSNSQNAIDLEIEQISIELEMNKYSIGQSVVYVDDFMPDTVEVITGKESDQILFNHGSRSCIHEMIRPASPVEQVLGRRVFNSEDMLNPDISKFLSDEFVLVPKVFPESQALELAKTKVEAKSKRIDDKYRDGTEYSEEKKSQLIKIHVGENKNLFIDFFRMLDQLEQNS